MVCPDAAQLEQRLQTDLEKHYEAQPLIVVAEMQQQPMVEAMARRNKWRWTDAQAANFQLEIRQWDYGLLLLSPEEGRGLDTRFRRPAHVAIIAEVKQQHELQQMVGRSSRTRGACEATLY